MNLCGKIAYQSEQIAEAAVYDIRAHSHEPEYRKRLLNHYHCDDCQAWHVGHSTPRDSNWKDATARA